MFDISVIVPTYNRASFLEKCLIGLTEQTIDPSRFEICVVANACTDNTPEIVAKVSKLYPKHRIFMIEDPMPGLSRARNTGVAATTAPYVAQTDDDGTVCADWLERILARFEEFGSDLAIVAGDIEPIWGAPKPDWLTQELQNFLSAGGGLGKVARFIDRGEFTSEGNGCYRRSMLLAAGGYPVELGRIGNSLLSGENVVEETIRKLGGRVFFDPAIILKHYIHAERLTPHWVRKRFFWQGVSGFAVRQYNIKHGIPVDQAALLELPLKPEDWAFINGDTSENITMSAFHFQSLGYALALTGLMPIEGT